MESSMLPWKWIVEHLASIPEARTSVLSAIVDMFPFVLSHSPNDVRERLALRYLEECAGMTGGETPPVVATMGTFRSTSAAKVDASRTCEEVLWSKEAISNKQGKGKAGLDGVDLHQFILQKRTELKKSSIELLKDKIIGSCHPDLSCSKEFNSLPKEPTSGHVNSRHRGGDHDKKKFVESMKDTSPCPPKPALIRGYRKLKNLPNNTSAEGLRGALQENTSSLQHLADRNAPDDEKRNQQTNVDDTCNKFLMEKTDANPGEGSAEIHGIDIQSPKENLLHHASPSLSAPNKYKDYPSENGLQKNDVLRHDTPELREVSDSFCDDVQLLEQGGSFPGLASAGCFCIKCGNGGQVLNCCGEGCSVAIHESCLGVLATVEKTADLFYCALCSYSNAVRMIEESKRKAQEAERNLLSFYEFCPAVRTLQRKSSSAKTAVASDPISVEHNGREHLDFPSGQRNNSVELEHGDARNQVTSRCTIAVSDNQEITQHEQNQLNVAADIVCKSKKSFESFAYQEIQGAAIIEMESKTDKEHESSRVSEDQQPVNDSGTVNGYESLSSEKNTSYGRKDDDARVNKKSVPNAEGGCDHSAKRKALASKISGRFGKRNRRDEVKGIDCSATRELRKRLHRRNQCSAVKKPCSRRPKLIWKAEEEEILEEAMQKIPQNDDGSIAWVRILEYGRRILHESRTPIDLKDKWRNMQKRADKSRG